MELLLRRSQKSGLMGGVKFTLEARVELTQEEGANVRKYKMSDILLYEKGSEKIDRATGNHVHACRTLCPAAGDCL